MTAPISKVRVTLWFAGLGGALPLLWLLIYQSMYRRNPDLILKLMTEWRIDLALFAFWPSSFLLIADPDGADKILLLIAIGINVILYGLLGLITAFAINLWKQRRGGVTI